MTATVTNIDTERRHFAEFLATRVLHYVTQYCAWPFDGEFTDPSKPKYSWVRADHNTKFRPFDPRLILRHVTGEPVVKARYSGLGIPILVDAGLAGVGVIDIDTHASGTVIDIAALAAVCDPAAVVTRSSSGRGIHIYLFPPVPVNSYVLRLAMERYVGHLLSTGALPVADGIDYFPKSHGLPTADITARITAGGSVRFPFAAKPRADFLDFDPTWPPPGDHPGEIFSSGRWVLDFSEKQRVIVEAQEAFLSWAATWGGPPCLGRALAEGVGQGDRNDLLYDAAYFAGFTTQDEAVASQWVQDQIVPQFSGTPTPANEIRKTVDSGIARAADPTKPQYVCSTSLCDKEQARCMRLGDPTQSGYTAGATASGAAAAGQTNAMATLAAGAGPTALSIRDGIFYIGETPVTVTFCHVEAQYCLVIGQYKQWFTAQGLMGSATVPMLSAMLQRNIILPRGTMRGWLTRVLQIIRVVATPFPHPMYGQLKSVLYQITQTPGESVRAMAVYDAMAAYKSITIETVMRHYPGTDWQPVFSPEKAVIGMRLVTPDLAFLTLKLPPPPEPEPEPDPEETDY